MNAANRNRGNTGLPPDPANIYGAAQAGNQRNNPQSIFHTPYSFDMDDLAPDVSAPDTRAREVYEEDEGFSPYTLLQRVSRFFYLIWGIIGCIVLGVAAWYFLGKITTAIAVICVAALVVFVLRGPVDWLQARGVPRFVGALIAYAGLLTVVVAAVVIIVPMLAQQLLGLISQVPEYIFGLEELLQGLTSSFEDNSLGQLVHSFAETATEWAKSFVSSAPESALNLGSSLVNIALVLFVSLVVGYWVLKDLPIIKLEVRALIHPRHRNDMSFVAESFSRALGGYIKGMLIAGTCVGIFTTIGFTFLNLPFPVLLGLIAGMMMFVPIFGAWVSGGTVFLIGMFISPVTGVLAVVVVVVAVQLTDYLITPRVMSSAVELHPAIILIGVLAGGALAGAPGLISAIPLLASAKSIFVYYFEKSKERKIAFPDGALFKTEPKKGEKTESLAEATAAE